MLWRTPCSNPSCFCRRLPKSRHIVPWRRTDADDRIDSHDAVDDRLRNDRGGDVVGGRLVGDRDGDAVGGDVDGRDHDALEDDDDDDVETT